MVLKFLLAVLITANNKKYSGGGGGGGILTSYSGGGGGGGGKIISPILTAVLVVQLSSNFNRGQKLLRQTRKTASYLTPQVMNNQFK